MTLARIGSQLFINRGNSPAQIRQWVRQMSDAGLLLIRLFVFQDTVHPEKDRWEWGQIDGVFEEAETLGMGIIPTLCAQTPPGWKQVAPHNQALCDLEDPVLWGMGLDYIRRVVSRYGQHAALDSWILWNEAGVFPPMNAAILAKLRSFMEILYAEDPKNFNKIYYPQISSFAELDYYHLGLIEGPTGPVSSQIGKLDWLRFCVAYLMSKLSEIQAEIRQLDTLHPIHVNPHALATVGFMAGQSIWSQGRLCDFLGASAHPVHHSTRFPRHKLTESIGYFSTLMRSATGHPERKFWLTELQGGMALYSGGFPRTPTAAEIYEWLWEGIGNGAEAIIFWCFNVRDEGAEGGEWGLLDFAGNPSPRLQATTQVVEQLKRHAPLFAATRPAKARVKILYSEAVIRLGYVSGEKSGDPQNPRNDQLANDALCGAYALLSDAGFAVDMIDEVLLREGTWMAETDLLVLPGCFALEAGAAEACRKFQNQGGFIIADGMPGWKNERGQVDPVHAETWSGILGAALQDVEADDRAFALHFQGEIEIPGWLFRAVLRPDSGSEILASWADERAGVICSANSLWIGTRFFQRYFVKRETAALQWLGGFLCQKWQEPLRLQEMNPDLRLHRLDHPGGGLFVLIHSGESPEEIGLTLTGGGRLYELNLARGGRERLENPGLSMEPHGVRVLQWERA